MLSKLGAKAAKSPRINAKIGLGEATKSVQAPRGAGWVGLGDGLARTL